MKTKKINGKLFELIGKVFVDSGQLMITDPCYIDTAWERSDTGVVNFQQPGKYSYSGCCSGTVKDEGVSQLEEGLGLAFSSGYGDGEYPVYAHRNAEGHIMQVLIDME